MYTPEMQQQGEPSMNPIIMIPARLNSVRLPKKVLADIHGTPMICRVAELATQSHVGPVYVACSEVEVKEMVESMGYQAVMTDPNLPSGTDRIFEAVQKVDPTKKFDVVINVQGDLPNFDPLILKDLLVPFETNPAYQISTLCFKITNDDDLTNPNVVKAILSKKTDAIAESLYFTRATPPASHREGTFYHHVGIYAYRRAALDRFVTLPPSPLEKQEKLEQLRALEDGMRIGAALIHSHPISVDTVDDLERVRDAIGG